jgi:hypothetical protein
MASLQVLHSLYLRSTLPRCPRSADYGVSGPHNGMKGPLAYSLHVLNTQTEVIRRTHTEQKRLFSPLIPGLYCLMCCTMRIKIALIFFFSVVHSSFSCPHPWRASPLDSNICYFVSIEHKTWSDAEGYCNRQHGSAHLMSILSAFENYNIDGNLFSFSWSNKNCEIFLFNCNFHDYLLKSSQSQVWWGAPL